MLAQAKRLASKGVDKRAEMTPATCASCEYSTTAAPNWKGQRRLAGAKPQCHTMPPGQAQALVLFCISVQVSNSYTQYWNPETP